MQNSNRFINQSIKKSRLRRRKCVNITRSPNIMQWKIKAKNEDKELDTVVM